MDMRRLNSFLARWRPTFLRTGVFGRRAQVVEDGQIVSIENLPASQRGRGLPPPLPPGVPRLRVLRGGA
jgi:hypothetical protein